MRFTATTPCARRAAGPPARAAAFLTAVLAGCGGGAPAADGAAAPGVVDACGFVSTDEASRMMGEAMQPGVEAMRSGDPATGRAMVQCQYDAAGSSASLSVQVIWSGGAGSPASLAALIEETRASLRRSGSRADSLSLEVLEEAEPVDGIGRFGYWLADGRILTVHTGQGHLVTVGVGPSWERPDPAADLRIAREVAAVAMGRL